MAKKTKSERLDLILSELQKIKSEVRAIVKQQAELAVAIDKLAPRKPASRPPRKATKSAKSGEVARKTGSAPKRPVLVSPGTATG